VKGGVFLCKLRVASQLKKNDDVLLKIMTESIQETVITEAIHRLKACHSSFSFDDWILLDADNRVVSSSPSISVVFERIATSFSSPFDTFIGVEGDLAKQAIETMIAQVRRENTMISSKQLLFRMKLFYQPVEILLAPAPVAGGVFLIFESCLLEHARSADGDLLQTKKVALQQLSATLRSISEGVITTNAWGIIELMNPKAESITEWNACDAIGRPLWEVIKLLNEKDDSLIQNPIHEVINSDLPIGRERGVLLQGAAGTKVKISFNISPILDDKQAGWGVVMTFDDITQKVRIESELQKIHKMDSLAMLSAGIAHDFNNFLTTITGNLSLARSSLDSETPLYAILKNAERGTQHAKLLTDRLYSFSRTSSPLKKPTHVSTVIEDTAKFIFGGTQTQWKSEISSKLWVCKIDEGQISQVLNNLFINANQAMPDGGKVTVKASNRQMIWNGELGMNNGPYVEIKIIDEGCGIESKHLDKLFEPYFTTKPRGNGLGLASSYSIIKSHEGHIEVNSTLGVGTTFTLYLPASPHVKLSPSKELQNKILYGVGRILLMDDEELVQDITGQMLNHLGYTVEFARNGKMALEKFKEAEAKNEPFNLVILDLSVSQGAGGIDALKMLRDYAPNVKTILSSGYSHRSEVRFFDQYGFNGVIIKPYNIEQLSWSIQQIITA